MLQNIQDWLGHTGMADYVRSSVTAKALLESVHILAMGLVLFSVGMISIRLMGLAGRSESATALSRRFGPWLWAGMAMVLITGLVLLTGAGQRGLANPMFAVKMALMFAAILLTAALQASLAADTAYWELTPGRRALAKLLAPLCFLLWLATVCAGRWLAYWTTFFPPAY